MCKHKFKVAKVEKKYKEKVVSYKILCADCGKKISSYSKEVL